MNRTCFPRLQYDAIWLLVVMAIVLICTRLASAQTPSTPAAGFQGIWYEVTGGGGDYPNKYGGGLATYPQQIAPLAIYAPEVDRTFFTFSLDLDPGTGRTIGHVLSYYDHATGLVARPRIWLNKQTSDAHDAPVLCMDRDGYLYLFSMNHGESRRAWIRRSGAPYDIGSYEDLLSENSAADMAVFGNPPENPIQTGDPRFSYASAWYVPNAQEEEKFLLLHTRYLSGQRDLFTTSSVDADTWTTRKTLSQIESGQYQTSWIQPDGKTVGTIFNVHPTQGLDWRTDLYYLETSDQAQTWQTVDGITLIDNSGLNNHPLTSRPDGPSDGAALVYDAAAGERVYLKDVDYDAAGNPIILFLTSPSNEPGDHGEPGPDRFVKTAYWTGSEWSINDVTTTDHNYDHGSLYIESDGIWRIIAPFIDGPQLWGTGGEVGMWTSADQGRSWILERQMTNGSYFNHTYVQHPLNAHEDFYAFWADGNAWEMSEVNLYFANKAGDVFHLPFTMDSDFAKPQPFVPTPPNPWTTISGQFVAGSVDGAIASITVNYSGTHTTYAFDDLIGGELTAFGGQYATGIADIITPPGTTAAPAPEDRTGLLADNLASTGFVNLASWAVAFDEDIVNRPGPDILFLDWGGADTVDITIHGITMDDVSPTSESIFNASMSNCPRFQSDQLVVNTLAALLNATFHQGPQTQANNNAYGIDLSQFGFANGALLTAGTEIFFTDGTTIDPMGIFGLPAPANLLGDFDADGDVDGADFLVWQRGFGSIYDASDLADWQSNYGTTAVPCEPLCTVPEPSTRFLMAGLAFIAAWSRSSPWLRRIRATCSS